MSITVEVPALREVKKAAILSAVAQLRDISLAADALGLGKTTLYRKLREYGVPSPIGPDGFRRRTQRTLLKGTRKMAYDPTRLVLRINEHLRTSPDLSLSRLAGLLNIDRHTIERAVRSATGKTFRQLRNAAMLEKATKLLRSQPQLTKKEIASRLGYSSQSTLSRFLKANLGRSSLKTRLRPHVPKRHLRSS
jgi:AraC-like DNA-binding protein